MAKSPSRKPRGRKIQVDVGLPPGVYEQLKKFRDPLDEDRWAGPLIRRIVVEWLASKGVTSAPGTEPERGSVPPVTPKKPGHVHAPKMPDAPGW